MSDAFEKRERAFESVFFAKLDEERIQALREKREREQSLEELASSSGIADADVLQKILDLGVDATTMQALSLVPIVATAWADGEVTDAERDAAMKAAAEQGVTRESGAHELLQAWLDEAPGAELEAAWAGYLRAVLEKLSDEQAAAIKRDLLQRCREVAQASGGFLGIGSISDAESRTIQRLEKAMAS